MYLPPLEYHQQTGQKPALEALINRVWCMDFFYLCGALPDNSVDMILADLPYGITACSWDSIIPLEPMWTQFKRIIKPRGAIVLTASQPFTTKLISSNMAWFKYCWVWDKHLVTNIGAVKYQPLRSHEDIVVFYRQHGTYNPQIRKDKVVSPFGRRGATTSKSLSSNGFGVDFKTGIGYPKSIVRFNRPNNLTGGGYHPTQKPVPLFEYLIRTYTQRGEVIFDPVVGSGTTALAARNTGRRFVVGDQSAEYCQIARDRLATPYTPSLFESVEKEEPKAEQVGLF